jgi:iron complex outermembrane receptor protein
VFTNTTLRKAVLLSLYGASTLALTTETYAQDTAVQSVSIVGSRRATSSATDTTVPVDVIPLTKPPKAAASSTWPRP